MTNADKYLKERISIEEIAKEFENFCVALKENNIVMTYKQEMKEFLNCEAKPTLTEDERAILRNIPINIYSKIYRDCEGCLSVAGEEGYNGLFIYNHLFQFIKERRRVRNK